MNKNIIFLVLIVILIGIIGVAAFLMINPNVPTSQVTATGTKIAFENNGSTWVHTAAVFENVTLKNGTTTNVYADAWTMPENGKVIIDLSNEMGYGNAPLPPNTVINAKFWLDPVSQSPNGSAVVVKTLKGWSNAPEPKDNENSTTVTFPSHEILQLPASITQSNVILTKDSVKGAAYISSMQTLYVECQIKVNSDQSVTISILQQPELCNLVAGG